MTNPSRYLKVFLCHYSGDKPVVCELYQNLAAEGWIDPWLYTRQLLPGQDWREAIEEAVEAADIVIICLSTSSVNREGFIQKEMRYAREISLEKAEGTIFLIPIRLDDCEVPRGLRFLQWVDYFGEKKEQSFGDLLESLKQRYEQKMRLEAEERARAEEMVRKQAEERARLEAEASERKELEERLQQDARGKVRREMEEGLQKEAEEYARQEMKKREHDASKKAARIRIIGLVGIIIILICLVWLLMSHCSSTPSVIPTSTITPSHTEFPIPTNTLTLTSTKTETPTSTLTPTLTLTLTPTSTATRTPTKTPTRTLSPTPPPESVKITNPSSGLELQCTSGSGCEVDVSVTWENRVSDRLCVYVHPLEYPGQSYYWQDWQFHETTGKASIGVTTSNNVQFEILALTTSSGCSDDDKETLSLPRRNALDVVTIIRVNK